MDYEKKYKKALEWARKVIQGKVGFVLDEVLEKFPELKESADERIRKALITYFSDGDESYDGIPYPNIRAWLEKQGNLAISWNVNTEENKPALNHSVLMKTIHGIAEGEWNGTEWIQYRWSSKIKDGDVLYWTNLHELEEQGEETFTDKVVPKFKVGDTIRRKGSLAEYTIESISGECYHGKGWGLFISGDDNYELVERKNLWSEEDEAVLDALIQRLEGEDIHVSPHLAVKCLKSLKYRVQPQSKREWSEEDENFLKTALWHISYSISNGKSTDFHCDTTDWLKFLKYRVQPPVNVTDEELAQAKKDSYNAALDKIEYHSGEPTFDDGWSAAIDYIQKRSFRPLNIWKPSAGQVEAVKDAIEFLGCTKKVREDLKSLYEQLKKLK